MSFVVNEFPRSPGPAARGVPEKANKRGNRRIMALVALKDVSVAFGGLQQALEAEGGWELKRRVESILGRTRLDGERPFETLEEEQSRLYALMADPGFYRQEGSPIARARARLEATARELEDTYRRWETLDALSNPDAGPPPPQ